MEKTAILFDLDGTLLPMDYEEFARAYLKLLAQTSAPLGYEPKGLIDALWAGVRRITDNDGARTNYEVFWDTFSERLGDREKVMGDIPAFNRFYTHEFELARPATGDNPLAPEAVRLARQKADCVILATMPQFPRDGIITRLRWVNLSPEDFDDITGYEDWSYSKPNPAYYTAILAKHGVRPENALMIGNDVREDISAAQAAGIRTYLVTDWMIGADDTPETAQGTFAQMLDFLKALQLGR